MNIIKWHIKEFIVSIKLKIFMYFFHKKLARNIKKHIEGHKKKNKNPTVEIELNGKKFTGVFVQEEVHFKIPFPKNGVLTIEGKIVDKPFSKDIPSINDQIKEQSENIKKITEGLKEVKKNAYNIRKYDCNGVPYTDNKNIINKCVDCGKPLLYGKRCIKK